MDVDATAIAADLEAMQIEASAPHMRALIEALLRTHSRFGNVQPYGSLHSIFVGILAFASRLPPDVLHQGARILDVGSGHGRLLIALKEAFGVDSYGVDKFAYAGLDAANVLTEATQTLWSVQQAAGLNILSPFDIEKQTLPYPDNHFDAVTCQQTVEHFHDTPKPVFEDIFRVLKPGGIFVLDTPNHAYWGYHLKALRGETVHWDLSDYYNHHFSRGVRGEYLGHTREFTLDELELMLGWAGFTILKAETAMYAPGSENEAALLEHYLGEIRQVLSSRYGAHLTVPPRETLAASAFKMRRLRDTAIVTARKPG